jgi:hypothetical protein
MKKYVRDFIELFFDKSKKLYNINNLPQLTADIDSTTVNPQLHSLIKDMYEIKGIPNENVNFYIASYSYQY